jgi:DNA-binding transcriptional ArsR family regulator
MHALVRFAHVAAGNSFRTCELHALTAEALGCSLSQYRLSSLRYDLSKLRAKGLVEKIPGSRRYRLLPQGYSICVVFLKLFERIYAPLTAGLLRPFSPDSNLQETRRSQLDRLYARVLSSLEELLVAVGLKAA